MDCACNAVETVIEYRNYSVAGYILISCLACSVVTGCIVWLKRAWEGFLSSNAI